MAGLQDTFYRCFIEDNRWRYLTRGLGNTLLITFFALLIGVALGVVVAIVRTAGTRTGRTCARPGTHPAVRRERRVQGLSDGRSAAPP